MGIYRQYVQSVRQQNVPLIRTEHGESLPDDASDCQNPYIQVQNVPASCSQPESYPAANDDR